MWRLRNAPLAAWHWLLAQCDGERGRFALWLPVLLATGVLVYSALRAEPPFWLGAAVAVPALAVAWLGRRHVWPWLTVIPVASIAIGFAAAQLATLRALPVENASLPSTATWLTGRIVAVEALSASRRIMLDTVRLEANGASLVRTVRVRLRAGDAAELATGDLVRLRAMVRAIGPPTHPGGWDMQRDAYFSGLGATGYALSEVERLTQAVPSAPMRAMQRLREAMADRIVAAIPGGTGQVTVGVLLGIQTGIRPADMTAFRDSGLAHILSVSGLHLAIVFGTMVTVVRLLFALSEHASLFWPTRQIAMLIALAVSGFYTALTGMQVPTLRCFVMACFITLAMLAGRRPFSLRGLAITATVIILEDPSQVTGASMQMSFSAVLALIAGFEALRPVLRRLHGASWTRKAGVAVLGLALTSALAGTASMPFGMYHFGRLQLYYILSNMIAVPLTSVLVMPAGMLALPLMLVNLESVALVPVAWGIDLTLMVAHITADLPAATLDVPHMPAWGLAVLSFGMAWLGLWRGQIRLLGVLMILLGLLSPATQQLPDILVSGDGRLIAFRSASGVFVQQSRGGSSFIRESWLHYWAEGAPRFFPPEGQGAAAAIKCSATACLLRPRAEATAALLVRGTGPVHECAATAVIVSAEPARGLCPRPWPKLVDRFTVWRDGPTAIWLGRDGATILTDRANRGARPWVPPPPTPRHRQPTLPMAPAEGRGAPVPTPSAEGE
ncbi:MAG: ComEC/Rec2 family competence protein [Acetobacteraceae bacterium]